MSEHVVNSMDSTLTSQVRTLRLSNKLCEIPRPRSAGVGRRCGSGARVSLMQRCTDIEDNMMRNLEMMREHRLATKHITERRKEQAERQIKELQGGEKMASALEPWDASPKRDIGAGSMRDRCAALEDHLHANDATMRGHRSFLNEVYAIRKQANPQTHEEEDAAADAWASASDHFVAVAWRPPSASQRNVVASSGLWTAQRTSASTPEPEAASASGEQHKPISGRFTITVDEFNHTRRRPVSACSSTPPSGLHSWAGSRPPSAGSMKARCLAIEENLQKNKESIATNKKDFSLVVKERQAKQKSMMDEMLRDLKAAATL